jgi:hypothetical protein
MDYKEISKIETLKIKEVKDYQESLDNGIQEITNFRMNNTGIKKLLHPIKTVRNSIKYKRLIKSKNELDKLLDTGVLQFEQESTGEVEQDLVNSAYKFKPAYIKEYVNNKR